MVTGPRRCPGRDGWVLPLGTEYERVGVLAPLEGVGRVGPDPATSPRESVDRERRRRTTGKSTLQIIYFARRLRVPNGENIVLATDRNRTIAVTAPPSIVV